MITVNGHDIKITKGDSNALTFDFYNADKSAYNLRDGETVYLIVSKSLLEDPFESSVIQKYQTNTGKNFVSFTINSEDTEDLSCGDYVYTIRIMYNNTVFTPYDCAKFTLNQSLNIIVNRGANNERN